MEYTSRNPRFVTRQIAVLRSDAGKAHGLMVDLNAQGAQLAHHSGNLVVGDEVTLEIPNHKVTAKVVWRRDGRIGLSFDDSLPADTISALNKTGDDWVIY